MWRRLADVALVTAVVAWGEADVWAPSVTQPNHVVGFRPLLTVCYAATGLVLLLRRTVPLAGAIAALAVLAAPILVFGAGDNLGAFLPVFVAMYSVGAHSDMERALAGLGAFAVWSALFLIRDPFLHTAGDFVRGGFYLVLCAVPWAFGVFVRNPRLRAIDWERRAIRLQRERRAAVEAAARAERAHIARELHDVVTHTVGVILRQAQAGEALLATDPSRAVNAFRAIEGNARETMIELRRMLGLLREDQDADQLAPQPGLDRLPTLIDEMRSAGLDVRLETAGARRQLSRGLDLNAYRIVQEALTNSVKHAHAQAVQVRVRYADAGVEIEVTDDGVAARRATNSGHGLIGMKERVHLHGGQFEFGSGASGGFRVWAMLPLESADP